MLCACLDFDRMHALGPELTPKIRLDGFKIFFALGILLLHLFKYHIVFLGVAIFKCDILYFF